MKTSNFKKVISVMLMCFMLVGTLVGFSVSAETADPTIEIVSNNVEYGDDLKLMYAVEATNLPEGASIKVVIYDENGEFVANTVAGDDVTLDGATLPTFVSEYGVAAQNISTVLYAEAQIVDAEGNVLVRSAQQEYSVLEYLWERKTICDSTDYQIAMYDALLTYAETLDIAINKGTATADNAAKFSYVAVVDENYELLYADMYVIGDVINELDTDLVAGDGEYIEWAADEYKSTGMITRKITASELAEDGYTVADYAVVFTAYKVVGDEDELVEGTEKLSIFATTGVMGTKSISWAGAYITFTNNQDASTTSIRNHTDTDHYRCYAKSQVVISSNNGELITKIVITATSSSYATVFVNCATDAGYTASASGSTVTITLAEGVESVTFSITAQARLNAVEVTYLG